MKELNFDEIITNIKKVTEDVLTWEYDWYKDTSILIKLARFLVEGEVVTDKKLDKDEYGNIIYPKQIRNSDYITINLDRLDYDDKEPHIKITKVLSNCILIDIFDVYQDEWENPYYEDTPDESFEIYFNKEEIKDILYYKMSLDIEQKSNNEIVAEMKAIIAENYNKFEMRKILIRQYGAEYANKFTWIMYNLLEV